MQVKTAMRYQEPSIDEGLKSLINKGCSSIQVIPLYPHYAISSTLTTKSKVIGAAIDLDEKVDVNFVEPFYNKPEYIDSLCSLIKEHRIQNSDLLLFSYHGIPIRQLRKLPQIKKTRLSIVC